MFELQGSQGTQDAPIEMARLLDTPPALVPEVLRGDTRLTERWVHGPLDGYMHGMKGHVVVGCPQGNEEICWRIEKRRFASHTRRTAFTLMPEGHDGYWHIAGRVIVSHVYLTQQHLQSCADTIAGGESVEMLVRVAFEDPSVAGLLEILSHEAARNSASARLFVEQAIDLLCMRLVQGHSSIEALPAALPRQGLANWQLRRVTAYMRDNLDRQIGLEELAALVNLSRFHFCTAFRRATGYTPHQWLTQVRIARARELLADPTLGITEVALAVGYETPSAFTSRFRKSVGVTPSDFRRSL